MGQLHYCHILVLIKGLGSRELFHLQIPPAIYVESKLVGVAGRGLNPTCSDAQMIKHLDSSIAKAWRGWQWWSHYTYSHRPYLLNILCEGCSLFSSRKSRVLLNGLPVTNL